MIPTYYDTPEMRARLVAAAQQLIGTPFFANSEAPGRDGGIDCAHAINWVHRTCGAVGKIDWARQAMDAGQHSDRSLLIAAFETWPGVNDRFARLWNREAGELDRSQLLAGDTLCFIEGHVPHHGGVLIEGGDFLHVLRGDGAHTMNLNAVVRGWRILGRLAAVYRPLPLP